ncbi:NAD(P)H-quinone oxidoreductase [Pilimelia columellifera]|uniref:NAD(P)H-quinone oxidoreductase n=1 Tax=Pilimelia columellifera subsp. columellifera TaxID=706583 RepID=A0ABN3NAZ5_9ACTN
MRAITVTSPGGAENLRWTEVPDPGTGPGEALVRVAATAVNRADLLQRQGLYPPPPDASPYLGLECSGTRVDTGEPVCALLAGGGYAELVAVPAGQLLPVPRGLDLVQAATLPEVACTVWSNMVDVGRLRAGETLLVHGGGGGIGAFAVQFGRALGARVITTARTAKHKRLRELGADVTIDYRTEDFAGTVRDLGGADVILDVVGASYLPRNIAALAVGGRIVTIGLQGGRRAELDFAALMAKRGSVSATTLRSRPVAEKATIVRSVRDQVWPLIESGQITPTVDSVFSLPDASDAHRRMQSSDHLGKIALTVPAFRVDHGPPA